MVDSVVDNISLRTQRKAEIKLDLDIKTTTKQIQQFINSLKEMMQSKNIVDSYNVHLAETGKDAHIIALEFFVGVEQAMEEFIDLKEEITICVLKIIEDSQLQFAIVNTKK